jgi:hypothetical protein
MNRARLVEIEHPSAGRWREAAPHQPYRETSMVPERFGNNPMMVRIKTDLPLPDPPI